jgi:hypothetical protein
MPLSSPIIRVAGSPPARATVNAGFHLYARRRAREVARLDPAAVQERTLRRLVRTAAHTAFGRDHGFPTIETVADFQARVPTRTYEDLWNDYLKARYPVFDDLTWPGRIPYLALTSGTTTGASKFIPVSRAMVASNRKAAQTMVAAFLNARPSSRLFRGKLFFLGGATDLESPAPGVGQGDLSAIAAKTVGSWLRPYTFPPLEVALLPNWDRKLDRMARESLREPVTLVSGVSSCLVSLFQRVVELSGKGTVAEVWPMLEVVVHGGVKFDPYREPFRTLIGSPDVFLMESYPCSEGFIAHGDPDTGLLRLLLDHGIFYEFVPADELGSDRPTRHWLGNAQTGVNYAIVVSTCAGMWAHVIGDTVRFERLDPPLLTFTGRTKYTLSAFGEHLISEEVEGAVASASASASCAVKDWHVGPVFHEPLGHHAFVVEFLTPPADLAAFRAALDAELSRRNAHYQWFRAEGGGLGLPEVVAPRPGAFDDWMRSRGKLGGQHKVPRMDSSGRLTGELLGFLREGGMVNESLEAGPARR